MAASSSSTLQPLTSSSIPQHDIFLSHSGAQKPFATALYDRLQTRYSTFFDITAHSLPLGEDFPSRIFHAAETCRLAVVVLSQEYVRSKWPMLELCAFFDATPQPKIVPLFFKLEPTDLKQKQNKERWRAAWEEFAREDRDRIVVSKWESALKKLSRCNGISLSLAKEESAYVDKVFSCICENLLPSVRYDFSGIAGIHRMSQVVLDEFKNLDNVQPKVCIVGMHGLLGSGKSTLCRYLCAHLFSEFGGKVLHLELPGDADDEKLLVESKKLLKQIPNFNNKMDLSNVSHIREVYYLLRGTCFLNSRLFLVVDNISSQESQDFVKALVRLGLAPGSKVLLVARSISVLRCLLQEDGLHQNSYYYVYGSMSVPSLNNEEALRVLLQYGDGVGLADDYAPEVALTPRDRQMMEEVVNMSSFNGIHLPLVLKIMGEQLREHKLDVEIWNKTMTSFLIGVGMCKEEALKQLVLQNFRALPTKLQTLFLDVALFILPLSYLDGKSAMVDEAFLHLSLIQGCNQEEIEFKMRKLEKHGFLTIWQGGCWTPIVSVHDFYLEFAASIEEASKYYWSSGLRWSKVQRNQLIEVARNTELGLRTVVLELEEGHEEFQFSAQFSSVKAMVLRNCKSLKTLQGIENLTGLASVEIHNCPSLKWVDPPAIGCGQPNVQRFRWSNQEEKGRNAQQELEALSMSKKPLWKAIWESLPQMGMIRRRMMKVDDLLLQMRGLEVLRLENTGIRQLVALSGCLPELRVLEVRERHMKQFHVCNLPNLEDFGYFGDASSGECWRARMDGYVSRVSLVPRKGVMTKRGFLAGCPKLQCVKVQCASFEDGRQGITIPSSHLKYLWVNRLWNESRLPDLTAAAESLEALLFSDCRELISLNLGCAFRNLQILNLRDCPNVTEVTGLDGLPNLHTLLIKWCTRLKIVSGLGGLARLREFEVGMGCPKFQHCLLPDLESLTELRRIEYCGPWLMDRAFNVRELLNLEYLDLLVSSTTTGTLLGIENLNHLKELRLEGRGEQILNLEGSAEQTSATGSTLLVDLATLILGVGVPSHLSFRSTSAMCLDGLRTLASLKGIEFLDSLTKLELWHLPNLTSLEGIESLRDLQDLSIHDCSSVEELPSLSALGKLRFVACWDCDKLSSVEGLQHVESVSFVCCKSLACFPLTTRDNWQDDWNIRELSIFGSKFASAEAAMAWVEDEEVPQPLHIASIKTLRWELRYNKRQDACDMVLDKVFLKMAERGYDDDNYDGDTSVKL